MLLVDGIIVKINHSPFLLELNLRKPPEWVFSPFMCHVSYFSAVSFVSQLHSILRSELQVAAQPPPLLEPNVPVTNNEIHRLVSNTLVRLVFVSIMDYT